MSQSDAGAALRLSLYPAELDLLIELVGELRLLVAGPPSGDDPLANWAAEQNAPALDRDDPIIQRLFPPAYGEAEPDAEYRRLTEAGLRATKEAEAAIVLEALRQARWRFGVTIPPDQRLAWLRTLNAMRLIRATGLGVTDEASAALIDDLDQGDPRYNMAQLYHWLGYLLEAVLAGPDDPSDSA
ncbi:MAG: DUF2017 domain-containing protein [Propionibacteriaceae bacterium]|jgi:hypothetical protein|nr:DUF2017 domain-containing protein [Propionibacteriaceae bacterium]